jgi:hypothetical protein
MFNLFKKKTTQNSLKTNCRLLTKQELHTEAQDFQRGIEFIGWYDETMPVELDNYTLMQCLKTCLEGVKNEQVPFPIDAYNSYEDLAHILGAVLAYCYENEFKWQKLFLEDIEEYAVVSQCNKFGVRYHLLIYAILVGRQENTVLLGYNMIKEGKFPEYIGNDMNFIY